MERSLSCCNQDTAAKKVISGTAIRSPLQQLQPIDLSLDRTCAPRFSECCQYCVVITINTANESIKLCAPCTIQPVLERASRIRLRPLLYERGKGCRQLSRSG